MTSTILVPTITPATLAAEINHAHRAVTHHAKSMLMEAKRAGEALLEAKKLVRHGEFKAWVEANCQCSYPTAAEYMRVVKASKNMDLHTFEGGIRAFLEAHSTPRSKPTEAEPSAPSFDKAEAEYAMKLHRMAISDSPNEAAVAHDKLTKFASQFGKSAGELAEMAEEKLGLNVEPMAPFDAFIHQTMQPYQAMPKKALLDVVLFCIAEHRELIKKLKEKFQ